MHVCCIIRTYFQRIRHPHPAPDLSNDLLATSRLGYSTLLTLTHRPDWINIPAENEFHDLVGSVRAKSNRRKSWQ